MSVVQDPFVFQLAGGLFITIVVVTAVLRSMAIGDGDDAFDDAEEVELDVEGDDMEEIIENEMNQAVESIEDAAYAAWQR